MIDGLKSWFNFIKFWWYFFSIPLLLKTLFSAWHRDIIKYPRGFDLKEFAQTFVFNLLSRLLGAFVRSATIIFGLAVMLIFIGLLPIFIILPFEIKYSKLVKLGSVGKSWSYAYTPFLDKYSQPLHHGREIKLIGRQDEIKQIERILARSRQDNVLLVGQPGVGRKAVIKGFAQKVSWGLSLRKLNNRRVLNLNMPALNQDNLRQALDQAAKAGNIILIIDELHQYLDLIPIFIPYLSADELQVVAITDYDNLHYKLKLLPGLLKLFEKVVVGEPTDEETLAILKTEAKEIKTKDEVLQEIIKASNQYIQNAPQPEKSLDLLEELTVDRKNITIEDVYKLISEKTGIPLGEITKTEKEKLLNLEQILHQRIVNQEQAIRVVASAMRRSRTGLASTKKPIGVFLFLGPTGVGKTETAKALAFAYFGSEERMIRFDMSEFQEISAIDRLIDRLIKTIEQNPFSLLLLDEFEKAHHDLLNVFFQIFDEGRLTSASGKTVSFKNAIIIATSNARKEIFDIGLLNRFDDIVEFQKLSPEHIKKIVQLMLNNLNKRLEEKEISLKITPELINQIAVLGYDSKFGARPMARLIQNKIENQIADKLLREEIKKGESISLNL